MPTVVTSMRDGAVDFLVKPLELQQLRATIRRIFEDRRSRSRATPVEVTPHTLGLVGRTPRMIAIYKLIGQAAATRATVLIRGESGTGKELVANAIHSNAANASEPFIPVNCAALPSNLLESELFGHAKGSFTGAVNARRGRFAAAGAGTVFLDEIGDTSLDFQSKLLRVLQDREFYPVGVDSPERTEARVIAATHRNLEAMVASRTFREDLYYRLRVVEISIPPLRDRRADIPLLVAAMLDKSVAALGGRMPVMSGDAMRLLTEHPWPGNVRELENSVLRAAVLAAGSVIRPEHLSIASPHAAEEQRGVKPLHEVERDEVARALSTTGGHKARAADLLGISRPRLDRLIEKYDLK
jgi:DNA-binding NtrC family response regulator